MSGAPSLVIRCDAGARHGLGHLSRCLGIASHAALTGFLVRFVCQVSTDISLRIRAAGFALTAVDMATGREDPDEWLNESADILLVDSKEMNGDYIRRLSDSAPVICFDDEEARDLPCRAVINNNIWVHPSDYRQNDERELWLGPKYNTISPAYFAMDGRERDGLLISMGGEDPHDHTSWLLRTLKDQLGNLHVHVCIGPAHPAPEQAMATCRALLPSAVVYRAPTSLIEPISHCALALTAGGTTCYELAAAGVSMAIIAVEDHQTTMRDTLVTRGAALSLGSHLDYDADRARLVLAQLRDATCAMGLARAANKLFNSSGIAQIVHEMQRLVRHN